MRTYSVASALLACVVLAACQQDRPPVAMPADTAQAPAATAPPAGSGAVPAPMGTIVFRATGNEPGWVAEVGDAGSGMRVEVDYGQTHYEVAAPSEGADGWAGSAADGTPIRLVVQRVPCQDDMSGQSFDAKVMLTVGTRQLHGCGNDLKP